MSSRADSKAHKVRVRLLSCRPFWSTLQYAVIDPPRALGVFVSFSSLFWRIPVVRLTGRADLRCPRPTRKSCLATPLASMKCAYLHMVISGIRRGKVFVIDQVHYLGTHRFHIRALLAHHRSIVAGRERRRGFGLLATARTGKPRLAASVAPLHLDYFRVLNFTHTQ